VGVVVENFHKCRESQEQEEKTRREERHARKLDQKRKRTQLFARALNIVYNIAMDIFHRLKFFAKYEYLRYQALFRLNT